MNATRQAGVLMHITSLPDGTLGPEAYRFVDLLAHMGVSVWQTLPVNQPHGDQSPYQSVSAHAGHPGMISSQLLQQQGWCTASETLLPLGPLLARVMAAVKQASMKPTPVNHTLASPQKTTSGQLSWAGFARFCLQEQAWLEDFALFIRLREHHGQQCWQDWPSAYRLHDAMALQAFSSAHAEALTLIKFTQYVFFSQWTQLKDYAQAHGVALFGDIPIFVAYDSADVWAHPAYFKLDTQLNMTVVAGVPPDYFSETGQRWGNPHYDWAQMQADGFAWWLSRIETQARLFDILRIDHFRGLQAAWEIPATSPTAIDGQWAEAPGDALLQAITQRFPQLALVAEDLGIITPEVDALRLAYDLPGMKILQFAFGGDDNNPYLPAQIDENSVAYTGTHDNDTTLGWYRAAPEHVRDHVQRFLGQSAPDMPQALIALTLQTQARLAIVPVQDILGLDSEARMNTPGTTEGNWAWRMHADDWQSEGWQKFAEQVAESGRRHG